MIRWHRFAFPVMPAMSDGQLFVLQTYLASSVGKDCAQGLCQEGHSLNLCSFAMPLVCTLVL
jgi:hypothetical protein